MSDYTEEQKQKDFNYFKTINSSFYSEHGHSYLAIKNENIVDFSDSVPKLIEKMDLKNIKVGNYLIQECTGIESAYMNSVMRLKIKG